MNIRSIANRISFKKEAKSRTMENFMKLLNFLDALESNNIYFRLNHIRNSILVEVAIPGERWEVEFLDDDTVEVERFVSDGEIRDEKILERLFNVDRQL